MTNLLNSAQSSEFAAPINFAGVSLDGAQAYSVIAAVTVTTPSPGTFTAVAATDVCTRTGHGMATGLKVQVSNSGGALPGGLSGATDYFVIVLDANTFKLATTLVNAQAGTAIDLTTNGTGTQTITPTALAGASVKLQGSNDDLTYVDLPSTSNNITVTASFIWSVSLPGYRYVRSVYSLTAGELSVVQSTLVKG